MGWFARKLDSLIGAVMAGVCGAAASQLDIFIQQYLQRLGGHMDEAQRTYAAMLDGDRYRDFAPAARQVLIEDARARVEEIQLAFHAIAEADLFHRPFAFLAQLDGTIAARTFEQFRPALPLDPAGLVFAGTGLVLGLLVYELIKAPITIALWRRRKRNALASS